MFNGVWAMPLSPPGVWGMLVLMMAGEMGFLKWSCTQGVFLLFGPLGVSSYMIWDSCFCGCHRHCQNHQKTLLSNFHLTYKTSLRFFPLLREAQIIFRWGSGSGKSYSGGRARKRHLPLAFICLKMYKMMQLCKLWNIIFVALFSCRSAGTDAKPWYRRKNHSRTSPRTSLRGYLCRCRRWGNPQVDIKILRHMS